MQLLGRAVELARSGVRVALATVIDTRGSVPRHPGALLVVCEDGSSFGTIGGGRVEAEVTREAAAVAAGAPAGRFEFHLTRDLAMCCGGSMSIFIQPVAPALDAFAAALELWAAREPGLLLTALDGSGTSVERVTCTRRTPYLDGDVFAQPLWPVDRLVMFGAGHVARAIGPAAHAVDFEVVVCDDDEVGALDLVGPWASRRVPSFEVSDVERALGGLGAADHVLVITRDHGIDERLVEHLLGNRRLAYLGLIGSMGKIGRFRKRLLSRGRITDDDWQRLRAPIGLDIGAETPAEIAISVLAELVALRRKGRA